MLHEQIPYVYLAKISHCHVLCCVLRNAHARDFYGYEIDLIRSFQLTIIKYNHSS